MLPTRIRSTILMLVSVASVLACQTEHAPSEIKQAPNKDTPRLHPDPGPSTVRSTGERTAEVLPELAVQADAIEFTEKGTYLRILVPESRPGVIIPDLRMGELTVTGPVHGNAVPSVDGLMVDNPWVYLRFPPGVKPPSRISVDGRMPAARLRRGARIKLTISHGTLTAKRTGIERAYLLAAARWFAGRTGWFERFAASRLAAMAGSKLEATPGRSAAETMRLADEHEVMGDLLQDRGAWKLSYLYEKTRWSGPIERPVPGGRRAPKQTAQPQPELIALARRIPKDAVFLIAPSAEALDGVAREMRQGFQWIAPFLAAVKNVYDPLFRAFRTLRPGDLIQSGSESGPQRFALYSRGVSLGELADVTLIVQFGSKTDLQAQLAMKDLKHLGPGILQRRGDLFLGWKETFLVFGRYQEDVRRTLELAGEGVDSDPYVWWHLEAAMRIEPRSIFAFVGYAAWTRLFSPENRQALARQRVARSELLAVEFCRMLFEWHEGRAPNGTRELLQTGYLRADELQHDDGRGSISLGTFAQSNWGRSEHLTPDDRETPFTVQEANGYRRFLEKWQPDLRMYARPVSLRMTATGLENRLSFLTSALDPRYFPGNLSQWIPNGNLPGVVLKPGLNLTIPLSTESELRRWLESAVRSAGRRREVSLKWAGSWLRLEIPDRASVPDGVQRALEVPEKNIRQSSDAVARRKKAIAQFPGTVVTPLADPAALAQSLRLLKAGLTEGLDGHLDWQELAPYRGFSITRFTETLSQERSRIGVSIAHSQDWVVLALNQTGIELAINRLMDAPLVAEGSKAIEGTLTLNDSKWLRNALSGVAETVVFPRRLQALNAVRSPHGAEGNPYGVQERPKHGVVHTDFGSSDMPRFLKLSRMKGPFSEHTDALSSFSISLKNEPSEAALTAVLKWTRKARQ